MEWTLTYSPPKATDTKNDVKFGSIDQKLYEKRKKGLQKYVNEDNEALIELYCQQKLRPEHASLTLDTSNEDQPSFTQEELLRRIELTKHWDQPLSLDATVLYFNRRWKQVSFLIRKNLESISTYMRTPRDKEV